MSVLQVDKRRMDGILAKHALAHAQVQRNCRVQPTQGTVTGSVCTWSQALGEQVGHGRAVKAQMVKGLET